MGHIPPEQWSWTTHEDCERFSQDFGVVADVEDLVPGEGEYTLEVSSPGLDRKLRHLADHQRFIGARVKVQTFTAIEGNRHWQGRLLDASEAGIVLDVTEDKKRTKGKKGGNAPTDPKTTLTVPLTNIEKANLVPEI
jgi:ribosome maturation factor RimP